MGWCEGFKIWHLAVMACPRGSLCHVNSSLARIFPRPIRLFFNDVQLA
ncbi:hypothetical protein THTE_2138 [Thermogutta terrifontis]|uniref:Uncharacterized protein n=1 Tax=Thermogutta terrifontis TaxID=1331910 RepID=A0A286RFK5_9BACT|nr:hypothetical protein THTE_2138 [Thermogutta terrifontis]